METLRLRHLAELIVSRRPKPDAVLKEIASKYASRNLTAAKGFAATAASILTSTVLPVFAKKQSDEDLTIILICGVLVFLCAACFFMLARMYAVLYVGAVYYLGKFRRLRPVLDLVL
ncbi:MAG TPA: hypothetical protein VEV41_01795 [Terriglobales bacterium]|jgi:Na+/melibiose symporter-like transporter|nr:hypothetical protein [Terriglobales bacterium]